MDIEDFFESIHFGRVFGRLCAHPFNYAEETARFVAHVACYEAYKERDGTVIKTSVLMPGGALSPILSNIVSDRLDGELSRLCRELGCAYSMYADDVSISSNRNRFPSRLAHFPDPENYRSVQLSEAFQELFERNGFRINSSKTRLQSTSIRQEVAGLVVNRKVNVKRNFVRQIRAMLHDWETHGLPAAAENHFQNHRPNRGRLPQYEAKKFAWVVHGKI